MIFFFFFCSMTGYNFTNLVFKLYNIFEPFENTSIFFPDKNRRTVIALECIKYVLILILYCLSQQENLLFHMYWLEAAKFVLSWWVCLISAVKICGFFERLKKVQMDENDGLKPSENVWVINNREGKEKNVGLINFGDFFISN